MTRYQMQHEIFKISLDIYPSLQHEQVYRHLEKVWTCTDAKLSQYLEILKTIQGK